MPQYEASVEMVRVDPPSLTTCEVLSTVLFAVCACWVSEYLPSNVEERCFCQFPYSCCCCVAVSDNVPLPDTLVSAREI